MNTTNKTTTSSNPPRSAPSASKPRQPRLLKVEKELRRDLAIQAKNPQALERKKQAREKNKMAKNAHLGRPSYQGPSAGPRVHGHLSAYVHQIANPRSITGVPPPYTDNLVQTVQATQVKVVAFQTIVVPAQRTVQMALFSSGPPQTGQVRYGGMSHQPVVDGAPGDQVASHTLPIVYKDDVGTTHYRCYGPIDMYDEGFWGGALSQASVQSSLGLFSSTTAATAIPLGRYVTSTAATGAASNYRWDTITPDNRPPYQGGLVGHARICNTGTEITLLNTTPQGTRAGDIVSVSPPHDYGIADTLGWQENLVRFKSFQTHAIDEPVRIVVPPRPVDMCYNHIKSNDGAFVGLGTVAASADEFYSKTGNANVEHASLHVFINNPSDVAQKYTFEVIANFSIGGDLVAPIALGVPNSLETKPLIVSGSVDISQKPTTTPSGIVSAFRDASERLARSGYQMGVAAVSPKNIMEMASYLPRVAF